MQVLTGTRREITVMEWQELLEKYMKRANDSMECFRRFQSEDDLEHLKEDAQELMKTCSYAISAIKYMEANGIK